MMRCLTMLIAVLSLVTPGPVGAQEIDFQSLDAAVREGGEDRRVIAVYFTADWCGWCRKMQADVFTDPAVANLAGRFAWAKVDMDAQSEVAAQFGVRSIPAILWFNADGALLETTQGYVGPDRFAEQLRELADRAEAPGAREQRLTAVTEATDVLQDPEADMETIRAAVDQLLTVAASPEREGRDLLQARLAKAGPRVWPVLVDAMEAEQLARRAAAYDLLTMVTGESLPFDPFADPGRRKAQVEAWRQWIAEQPPPAESESETETETESDAPATPDASTDEGTREGAA